MASPSVCTKWPLWVEKTTLQHASSASCMKVSFVIGSLTLLNNRSAHTWIDTDLLAKAFHKLNAPCTVIMTTRKLKTCLPSLKPLVPKMLRSNVVYKLTCPSCNASYVGQTVRHVQQRVREHLGSKGIMKSHFDACGVDRLSIQDFDFVSLLDKANKTSKLLTLEALYISKIKPVLNTKDEFKSRTLTLKLYW